MRTLALSSLSSALASLLSLLAWNAGAAEVGIMAEVDASVFRLRLDHVQFVDPITPPMVNQAVGSGGVVPGNVASLRLTVSLTIDPAIRVYDVTCLPQYSSRGLILVMGGSMSWDQVYSGVVVNVAGSCSLARSGVWTPAEGLRWKQ